MNDEREHINNQFCWCHPYIYAITESGAEVWVHQALDRSNPPSEILAEAVALARLQGDDNGQEV